MNDSRAGLALDKAPSPAADANAFTAEGFALPVNLSDSEAFFALIAEYDRLIARNEANLTALKNRVTQLTEEIEHKNRLLARQERLAALGEMAAGVAHEIRNPLGGIALYVDLLQRDLSGQAAPLTICTKISSAIVRMNRTVESILGFTRPIEPRPQPLDARALLCEAADMAAADFKACGATVEYDIAPGAASIAADHGLIHQILLNLVRNAAEASPKGGTVTLFAHPRNEAAAEGRWIEIGVRDRGAGVPEHDLPRLFTPFFTTKKGGTGLGLALCQRIAEAHGGVMEAGNHPQGGAVFRLLLPAIRDL